MACGYFVLMWTSDKTLKDTYTGIIDFFVRDDYTVTRGTQKVKIY